MIRGGISGLLRIALVGTLLIGMFGCASTADRPGDDAEDVGLGDGSSPADIYVELAMAYMQDGQLSTALRKIRYGLEQDPKNARAHAVLAIIYDKIGEIDRARTEFQTAVDLKPRDPYVRNAYGSFLCVQGEYEPALAQFDKAVENPLYGTPEVALANAGVCARRTGEPGRAETYLRRALQADAKMSLALAQMAILSFQQGNLMSARAYLQRYQAVADYTPETLWLGIRIERRLGDRDAVRGYEQILLQRFPDSPEVQFMRESVEL